jgi:hypothetical protein
VAIVIPILTSYSDKGMKQAFRDVQTADNKFRAFGSAAQTAFMAAGIGAGLFAVKLGKDAVGAAIDEQAELSRLNNTLSTLGFAAAGDSVSAFVDDLRFATGVADSELRPGMETLVRATNDVGRAQELLTLAVDISAQKQLALSSVVSALAKAEDGNTTALGKMNLGIDKSILKSQTARETFSQLAGVYGGAAAVQARTLQGSLARLTDGLGELQESAGTGAIDAFTDALGGTDDAGQDLAQTLRDLQPVAENVGGIFGEYAGNLASLATVVGKATGKIAEFGKTSAIAGAAVSGLGQVAKFIAVGPFITLVNTLGNVVGMVRQVTGESRIAAQALAALANAKPPTNYGGTGADPLAVQSARWTQYAKSLGESVSYAGGNLQEWLDDLHAVEDQTTGYGGSSGGSVPANDKLAKSWDRITASVAASRTALERASTQLEAAKAKVTAFANTTRDWLTSGINLGDAVETWLQDVAKLADLDKRIAEAITAGDEDGAAKLAAERAGMTVAASWYDGFTQQIADSKAAAAALEQLVATLNPADTLGNELLLEQFRGMDPAAATAAINDLVARNLGPAAAAALSETFGGASSVGTTLANEFYGSGVTAAQSQYDAISTTLEGKLANLYALGKKMGDTVVDGWNSAIAGLPADIKIPGSRQPRAEAPVNVTVNAGVGNPVEIARAVDGVLKQRTYRTGV